jgi:hypothetical protein
MLNEVRSSQLFVFFVFVFTDSLVFLDGFAQSHYMYSRMKNRGLRILKSDIFWDIPDLYGPACLSSLLLYVLTVCARRLFRAASDSGTARRQAEQTMTLSGRPESFHSDIECFHQMHEALAQALRAGCPADRLSCSEGCASSKVPVDP